ncbi:MAG: hypothetical protein Q9214_006151 [Letrouitia sp. 1 TL-2023]
MFVKKSSWEILAAEKRASTHSKIPREWLLDKATLEKASTERNLTGPFIESCLTDAEKALTKLSATSLLPQIRNGTYSALQVAQAFCKRTAIAQQINNCLHEIFFEQALQRAQELDDYLQEHKTTIGPLHGLPVSLKDQFHVRGNDTSMAYIGWLGTYEGSKDPTLVHRVNSQVVSELLSLGAVLYCKEKERCRPWAAVLRELEQTLIPGQTTYPSSTGFLSSNLDALRLIMASILSTSPWLRDPYVLQIPWREELTIATLARAAKNGSSNDKKPLKLGVFWSDDVVTPHPPVQRGLRLVADAVFDWRPPSQKAAKRVHVAFLKADGAHDIHRQLDLSGEPLIPPLRKSFELEDPISLLEYQALTIEGRDYEGAYLDYWNSLEAVDGFTTM